MPEYLSPAVYIEEVPSEIVPIQGVGTSTAGMVGQTERGPLGANLVTSWQSFQRWYGGYVPSAQSFLPFAVAGFFANGGQRLYVARVVRPDAAAAGLNLPTNAGAQNLRVQAVGPGSWGGRVLVLVRAGTRRGFRITVIYYREPPPANLGDPLDAVSVAEDPRRAPTVVEDFDDLGVVPTEPRYALSAVNPMSRLIQLSWTQPAQPGGTPNPVAFTVLTGGADGAGPTTAAAYTGEARPPGLPETIRLGLRALESIDDVAILLVPDVVNDAAIPAPAQRNNLREAVLRQCESLGDRFAVLDVAQGASQITQDPETALGGRRSDYAAIYWPFLRILDVATGQSLLVPPSGFVAGVYAYNDVTRGVHKAPANYEVRGILSVDLSPTEGPLEFPITKGDHDVLNPRGINVIRDFRAAGNGVRVWGARTLSRNPDWTYVNVRRLFLYLEESIEESMQWVVFEPNDESTWAKLRRSITAFLDRVWRDGALFGATAEEAFFVRCDRTTMTPDDIISGRLICLVGVAPVRPAEFVIIRFSQKTIEAAA